MEMISSQKIKTEHTRKSNQSHSAYYTEGNIELIGNCVVFNLQDSGIYANVAILSRYSATFSAQQMMTINKLFNQYKVEHHLKKIQFYLYRNESNLCLIGGQLLEIITYLRQRCEEMVNGNKQPLPFIKIFKWNHMKQLMINGKR